MPIRIQTTDGRTVEFPDGTSQAEMEAALRELPPLEDTATGGPPSLSDLRPMASHAPSPEPARNWAERALQDRGANLDDLRRLPQMGPSPEALPAVGGSIGGVFGSVPGAIAGGSAGTLVRDLLRADRGDPETPQTPRAALGNVATEGAIQGAMEYGGGLLSHYLPAGARRLYTSLLKPSKALTNESPDVVETLLKERALISPGGLAKVEGRQALSKDEADALIAAASPTAAPVRAREIVPEFADTISELRKRMDVGQPSALAEVGQRGRNLMRADRGVGFPLTRAQELKRTAQDLAAAGYRQAERGTIKEVTPSTMLDKDVARGFRSAIEQRVPEVAAVNQRTQSLGSGTRALQDALERESKTMPIGPREFIGATTGGAMGGAGGAAAGAGAARLLSRGRTGSAAAIGMNELARLPHAQMLRLAQAIDALMRGDEPPE